MPIPSLENAGREASSADDGGADGCGSLTTAASPWHVLASSRLRATPSSFVATLIVPSAAREPRGPSACVPRHRPPRRPGQAVCAPLPPARVSCPEGQPRSNTHRPAHATASTPRKINPATADAQTSRSGDILPPARAGRRRCRPGDERADGEGHRRRGPGARAQPQLGDSLRDATRCAASRDRGLRADRAASTCPGDAAVVRDPQPSALPSSAHKTSSPALSSQRSTFSSQRKDAE